VIRNAANRISREEELSVSFIQIGHDRSARAFLQKLDDDIRGARFDIVDSLTCNSSPTSSPPSFLFLKIVLTIFLPSPAEEMQGMNFSDFIYKSIYD